MKHPGRHLRPLCLYLALLSFPLAAGSGVAVEPPDLVEFAAKQNLYQPVSFDHAMHLEMYSCNICHHHSTGDGPARESCARCHQNSPGSADVACSSCHLPEWSTPLTPEKGSAVRYHIDIPLLKGALHLQCVGCHQAESGPTGCRECHPFTAEGRAFFHQVDE
jgi:hypothetical protein